MHHFCSRILFGHTNLNVWSEVSLEEMYVWRKVYGVICNGCWTSRGGISVGGKPLGWNLLIFFSIKPLRLIWNVILRESQACLQYLPFPDNLNKVSYKAELVVVAAHLQSVQTTAARRQQLPLIIEGMSILNKKQLLQFMYLIILDVTDPISIQITKPDRSWRRRQNQQFAELPNLEDAFGIITSLFYFKKNLSSVIHLIVCSKC